MATSRRCRGSSTLPSIAAANLERQHKLTAGGDGAGHRLHARRVRADLLKGRSDPQATDAHRQTRHRADRPRPGVRAALRRPHRDRRLPARGVPRAGQDRQRLRLQRHRVRSVPVRARPAQQRSDPRKHHRADHDRDGRLRHARRRLEGRRRATTRSATRWTAQWDRDSDGAAQGRGAGTAPGGRGRSQAARADRARLERSVLPVHGLGADRRPDAGDGRSDARAGAGISRRPHVLQPRATARRRCARTCRRMFAKH